ncbi:thioredoxin domain-containing protein 15 isoform X1 [Onychostoma macrolepis]|uniref:thioredoxin domain-containing protein 15 isoform X1 n=1 Tax=Onychostoma macrolepis TaxID=369639 RepID=UPI00272AE16C|nr:thioredoxin domain-containing protein 15 isoform X1 [Onychostoma macrolepis]
MGSAPDRLRGVAIWLIIAGLVRLSGGDAVEVAGPSDPEQVRTAVLGAPQPAEMEQLAGEACAEGRCETETEALLSAVTGETQSHNLTETAKTYKVSCDKRNISGTERFSVQILNASQDLMELLNANSTECSLVLFYTTWCQFSANLAPHFNALPRVFPSMHFLALDASQHSRLISDVPSSRSGPLRVFLSSSAAFLSRSVHSLSTRFGTVAVPNILLFQGAKPMARFNQTDRTLETLSSFITNQTGFEASPDQAVLEEDRAGPLPAVPVKGIDWLFVFSVLFISGFTLYAILCSDSIRWLIPGQDHEHQD